MAAHDRLQAYLAAHLTVDGRITAESSASPYGDLVNIVEMLPDVLAEHAAEREARERAERDVARLRDDFTPCDDCDGSGIGPLVVDRTGQTGDEPCSVCGGMGGLQKSAAQWIAKWHEATTTWKSKAHEQKARADRAEAEAKRLREALSALLDAIEAEGEDSDLWEMPLPLGYAVCSAREARDGCGTPDARRGFAGRVRGTTGGRGHWRRPQAEWVHVMNAMPEVTDEDVDNILRAMPFASRESPTLCVRAGMRAALTADRAAVAARTAEPTPHPSAVEEVARAIDEASVLDGIARGDDGSAMFYAPEATAALADMRRRMLSHEAIQAARGVVYSGREWGPREMLRAAVDVAFGGEVAPAATIPTDRLTSAMRAHDATVGTYEERMAAALRAVDALDDVDDVIRDLRGEVAEWKARAEETRDRAGMEAAQTLATHSAEVARLTRERDAAIARAEKAEAAQVADFEALCRALSSHAVNGGMSHQIGAVRSVVDDLAVARLARPIPDALVRLVGAVRAYSDTIDSEGFCSLGLIRETLSAAEAAIAASKAGACECKETECPGHDEIGKPDCVNVVHQPWCRHHKPHPVATSGPVEREARPVSMVDVVDRINGLQRRIEALEGGGR